MPSHTEAWPHAPSVVVRFADLNVSRDVGATVLYQRLKGAAETVCAPLNDRDLARHMKFMACLRSAINSAVATVDQPVLTRYYEAKISGRNATIKIAQK